MRNWSKIDEYYGRLLSSVYPQPEDEGHTALAERAIQWMVSKIGDTQNKTLLDFGCGQGFCQPIVEAHGIAYYGVALGEDANEAIRQGRMVMEADFNFMQSEYEWDFGMSRHSLEHSPFPIISLIHWRKFIKSYLLVVLPHPDWYKYRGQNHFSVMAEAQAENVFEQSGWELAHKNVETRVGSPDFANHSGLTKYEIWYLLRKK